MMGLGRQVGGGGGGFIGARVRIVSFCVVRGTGDCVPRRKSQIYLDETNVGGLFTEALTADIEAVLADKTSAVGADTAVGEKTCG